MAAVRYILYLLFLLLVAVAALMFSFRNKDLVSIDFFFFQSGSMSLGFWVIASFLVGSLLGWLVMLPAWLELKVSNKQRSRQLKSKDNELLRLKGDTAK